MFVLQNGDRYGVPKSQSNDEIERRVMRDMESTMRDQRDSPSSVRTSRSFFNFEEEQKRMQEWGEQQERLRQVQLTCQSFANLI